MAEDKLNDALAEVKRALENLVEISGAGDQFPLFVNRWNITDFGNSCQISIGALLEDLENLVDPE